MSRLRLDPEVDVRAAGRVLVGGDPLRILRLSAAGAAVVARWRNADTFEAASPGEQALAERLVDAAMAHPAPGRPRPDGRVVAVVPVRDRAEVLARCLDALRAAGGVDRVIVVDDGSSDPAAHRRVVAAAGAELVRRDRSGGPAAARSTGAAVAGDADLLVFVDSDVEVAPGWLEPLVPLFDDPAVALTAPRVAHRPGGRPSVVDRYEAAASALDLGERPAPIRPGTRVAYVPAAALVVRREAFDAVGGFDATLQVGEDVDLVWRLVDAGWRCRYEPASSVAHVGRSSAPSMLRRRFDYGRSAAELDARHPGEVPPFRSGGWSAAVVALVGRLHPVAAAAVAATNVGSLARRLRPALGHDALPVAAGFVGRGHVGALRAAARAAVRPWLPITAFAALLGRRARGARRARRVLVVAAVSVHLEAWIRRRPPLDPVRWVALSLADDVAYTAGVWAGCVRRRRLGPLRPLVTWRRPTGQN